MFGKSKKSKTPLLAITSIVVLSVLLLVAIPARGVTSTASDSSMKEFEGGQVTSANLYPWMVALVSRDEPNPFMAQFCGGSLIAPDLVITAAHCVDTVEEISEIEVVVGVLDLNEIKESDRQRVAKIIIHKGWNFDTTRNDVAIIRLEDGSRNMGIPLIKLQDEKTKVEQGDLLKVLGWGETAPDVFPSVLQEGDVSAAASQFSSRCEKWQPKDYDRNSMICASGVNSESDIVDTCFGDSGGPLFIDRESEPELVGITSWGSDDCPKLGFPGLYTRVSNYLSWVERKISPRISSFSQSRDANESVLKIRGANFYASGIMSVRIGGLEASFSVVSPTLITAMIPAGVSSGSVVIRTLDDKIVSPKRFRVSR